jgi:hypothetical protein
MFQKLRRQWKAMTDAKPGKRFQVRYEQRRQMRASALWTPVYLLVGSAFLLLGLTMLVAPGPGIAGVFIGAALIGQESLVVARALDRLEVGLRRHTKTVLRLWKRAPTSAKAALIVIGASAVAGAGWGAYALFMK